MVQKWAVGALINITGSIAINLGTNLMKLSHKMTKGELPPGTLGIGTSARSGGDELPPTPSISSPPTDVEVVGTGGGKHANGSAAIHGVSNGSQHTNPNEKVSLLPPKGQRQELELTPYSSNAATENPSSAASDGSSSMGKMANTGPAPGGAAESNGRSHNASRFVSVHDEEEADLALLLDDDHENSTVPARRLSISPSRRSGKLAVGVTNGRGKSRGRGHRAREHTNGRVSQGKGGGGGSGRGLVEPNENTEPLRRRCLSHGDSIDLDSKPIISVTGSGGRGLEEELGESGLPAGDDVFRCRVKVCWYCGAVLLVAGSLVNFASFGFAPQSLLASLGSVQFVSNVVFGKAILHEVVTRRIIVGTATIILGNTLTLCFSPHQDENYNTGQLKAFYDVDYNILLALELTFALAMHATYKKFKRSKEQGKTLRYSDLAMPLAYAICSAIIGTQSVIQAKCLSELLTMTFQGSNQMGSPFTYGVIFVWLGTTVFWLTRMNRALAMFHGLFIIPALQVFWTFFSVIGGGFYFEEFKTLEFFGALGFAVGVLVVFMGVYLLAPRTAIDHGKRGLGAGRVGEDAEGLMEEGEADLRKMLKLEEGEDSGADYLPDVPVRRRSFDSSLDRGRRSREKSMEAGDEEIDWDHTRMLSLGFFPSISTDQDVGYLVNPMEALEHDRVMQRLLLGKDDRLKRGGEDVSVGRVSEEARDGPGPTRSKLPLRGSSCSSSNEVTASRDLEAEELSSLDFSRDDSSSRHRRPASERSG